MKTRGVIAATPPGSVEAGVQVLEAGGNAFDAAVATAWAQTVLDPCMCGIGGLGTATLVAPGKNAHQCVHFFARAGSLVRPDMWSDRGARQLANGNWVFDDFRNEIGYSAVGVPGTVAGLEFIREHFGRMPREDVMEPALAWARRGWTVTPIHEAYWSGPPEEGMPSGEQRLTATDACARLFTRTGGQLLRAHDRYENPDLVNTLEAIQAGGADEFYRGELGHRLAGGLAAHGSFVTAEDLADYAPRLVAPLKGEYRGYRVYSNPPPGGGVVLLQMLGILNGLSLHELPHNGEEYLHILAAVMCRAQDDRRRHLLDPAYGEVPVGRLLSEEYWDWCRERVRRGEFPRPLLRDETARSTTHLSAADAQGNMIGITHTLGTGSGVVIDGLGFMLNNAMSGFQLDPAHGNCIEPGKERPSAMAPTLVCSPDDGPYLAVGAPGGNRIVNGILQVLLNVLDHGLGATEAVCAPRIHCEGGALEAEPRIPSRVLEGLAGRGHRVEPSLLSYDRSMSSPHLVMRGPGSFSGVADPRRGGHAVVVE